MSSNLSKILRGISFPAVLITLTLALFILGHSSDKRQNLSNTTPTNSKPISTLPPTSKVLEDEFNYRNSKFNQTAVKTAEDSLNVPQILNKNVSQTINANGQYQIDNSTHMVYDPQGNLVKIKSVNAFLGRFAGGWLDGVDSAGQQSYDNRIRDLDMMKSLGINSIRVFVSNYYYNNYAKVYGTNDSDIFFKNLDSVITEASNRGMIIELANTNTAIRDKVVQWTDANGKVIFDKQVSYVDFKRDASGILAESQWLSKLSTRYASNSKVWIQPENEPNCEEWIPEGPYQNINCINWTLWQSQQQQFINSIRDAGNKQPIILNSPQWAGSLFERNSNWSIRYYSGTQNPYSIKDYPLTDTLNSLMYGIHLYPDPYRSDPGWLGNIDIADQNMRWGVYADQFTIIPDEIGQKIYKYNHDQYDWNIHFMNYIANAINQNIIPGVAAFTWFWGDNSMINSVVDSTIDNGQLSYWGTLVRDELLNKINGTINPSPTPTPIPTVTPTINPTPIVTPSPTSVPPVINYNHSYYVPYVSNLHDGITTYISLKNSSNNNVHVSIHYNDKDGHYLASDNSCSYMNANSICAPSNPFSPTHLGTATIKSDQILNIIVAENTPNGQTAYSVNSEISNSLVDTLAFNNTYGGFKTELNIFNTESKIAQTTALFYDSNGKLVLSKNFDIVPYGLYTLSQSNEKSLPNGFNGWIKVLSSRNIKGQVIEVNDNTKFISASSVQTLQSNKSSDVSDNLVASGIYNNAYGSFVTGTNIVNPNNNEVSVSITYFNSDGKSYTASPFTISSNGSVGIFDANTTGHGLPTGGLPMGFQGYAKIHSEGGSIAVSINENGNSNGHILNGTFTAIDKPTNILNLPVISKGFNGYITGFSIINTSDQNIGINIQYYNQDGSSSISKSITINPNSKSDDYQGNDDLPDNFYGSATITQTSGPSNSILSITNATSPQGFYTYTEP